MTETNNPKGKSFFSVPRVKRGKDEALKIRLQTLIKARGMTEPEFYHKIDLSKQYWYFISWGIWKPTDDLMFKISKSLDVDSRLIFPEKTGGERR